MQVEGKRLTRNVKNCQGSQLDQPTNVNILMDNSSNLSFIYTNADCFTNKRPDLIAFLNALSCKPSIIIITEINSKCSYNKMQEPEFVLDGYNMYCCNIGTVGTRE